MKGYVWQDVGGLTNNYHDGGGALVFAENEDAAWVLLAEAADALGERKPADASFTVETPPQDVVWIFPDAGCC